jgi:hypothetical protein
MIWDRLFGSYEPERDDDPPVYGILHNIDTYNPLRIAFHEWWAMGRDVLQARSLRAVGATVFGAPGWRADGTGMTSESVRAQWRHSKGHVP